MKRGETVGGVVIFLFGGITVILSLQMPLGTLRMAGSGLFPLWLGIVLMGLSILFLIHLRYARPPDPKREDLAAKSPAASKQMPLFLGATMLATLSMTFLGYLLTTFILMLLLLIILGVRRKGLLITLSLVTALSSYLLFVRWLKIPLPKGLIGL